MHRNVRRLQNKWIAGNSWPKRLEWLEIKGIRGWAGQKVEFGFPIIAIAGENGSGKSTILQAAAAVYANAIRKEEFYASDFFPDTPFETIQEASIRFSYREGQNSQTKSVRKPSDRWRGNPDRPKRKVVYIDLSRIQPVNARVGYLKLLKSGVTETSHTPFDQTKLDRLSHIMAQSYIGAGISTTSIDQRRAVPVVSDQGGRYSGFHQGAGIIAITELIAADFPRNSLVLIDEVETSLHPRAQRRLIRDLAEIARVSEVQFILSTHSPYVLSELPPEGRIYVMNGAEGKAVVTGVSPEFAMTRMDEETHPECDVYVEDSRAACMVSEALVKLNKEALLRSKIIPFGSASVGAALGMMVQQRRFPRPSVVFLDGDQSATAGCIILPGVDAPERVVFCALSARGWPSIATRIGRSHSEVVDALNQAMAGEDHHNWPSEAANRLVLGSDILWQAMCAVWADSSATQRELTGIVQPVIDALSGIS
jgi:predicted ATPase